MLVMRSVLVVDTMMFSDVDVDIVGMAFELYEVGTEAVTEVVAVDVVAV